MAIILIVEDDFLIAAQLKKQIEKSGHICCGHAAGYKEAVELFEKEKPELVLLDIRLRGKKNGIDLARFINAHYRIPFIYISSHFEKSILEKAKNTSPAGYLTKPYNPDTLNTTVEICLFNYLQREKNLDKIEVSEGKKKHLLCPAEIYFIEADHVYARVVLSDKSVLIRKSLNQVLEKLSDNMFIRVHKSFVVNITRIQKVNGTHICVMGNKIPIGRTFRKDVLGIIGARAIQTL